MSLISFSSDDRVGYLRALLLLAATMLPILGFAVNAINPELQDPLLHRILISAFALAAVIVSFLSKKVKKHLQFVTYAIAAIAILWINYLLYANAMAHHYTLATFWGLVGISLVIRTTQHLMIFTFFFYFSIISTVAAIPNPVVPPLPFLIQFTFLTAFVYIALSNFLNLRRQLALSNRQFKILVDSTDIGYCLMDIKGRILKINRSARMTLKRATNRTVIQGQNLSHYLDRKEEGDFTQAFNLAATGKTISMQREVYFSKNAKAMLEIRFIPIREKRNTVSNVLLSARNITKERLAEHELTQKNSDLEKANYELDSFVYRAAHDLRAPLASVLGLIDLIGLEEKVATNIGKYLGMMRKSINKLDLFIQDVVNYSRNSRVKVTYRPVDFKSLLLKVFDDLSFIDGAKEVVKQIDITGDGDFCSDISRLKVIFYNLISNSIRYRDSEKATSTISINIKYDHKRAVIAIHDNGIGIEEAAQEEVFNIFFRASEASSGSGLGLFVVKEAIRKLSGNVELSSEPSSFTQFKITLPNQVPTYKSATKQLSE